MFIETCLNCVISPIGIDAYILPPLLPPLFLPNLPPTKPLPPPLWKFMVMIRHCSRKLKEGKIAEGRIEESEVGAEGVMVPGLLLLYHHREAHTREERKIKERAL